MEVPDTYIMLAYQSRQYLSSTLGHIVFKFIMLASLGDIEGLELRCLYKGLKTLVVTKPGFLNNPAKELSTCLLRLGSQWLVYCKRSFTSCLPFRLRVPCGAYKTYCRCPMRYTNCTIVAVTIYS